MKKAIITILALGTLAVTPVMAQNFSVKVTNLSNGIHFTPLLITAHTSATRVFEVATSASTNLQAMAEGGDISGLVSDMDAAAADTVANPAAGILAPGAVASADFANADDNNTRLSIVAMLLPTNDGFVGLDSLEIPTTAGTYTYYLDAYDAGTETNDEIVNGGGALGTAGIPKDPGANNGTGGSGVSATGVASIHIHRGILGDTDATGGVSDLDSRVHRWLNPIARLVVTVN